MVKAIHKRWSAAVFGAGLLLVGVFVMQPGVAAQTGTPPVVQVGPSTNLVANILSNVPVTLTCAPRTPDASIFVYVTLEQAVNGKIAYGSGNLSNGSTTSGGPTLPVEVVCDGSPHRFMAGVVANTAGAPFGGGQAIVSVSVTVCTINSYSDCNSTTVGPRAITQSSDA